MTFDPSTLSLISPSSRTPPATTTPLLLTAGSPHATTSRRRPSRHQMPSATLLTPPATTTPLLLHARLHPPSPFIRYAPHPHRSKSSIDQKAQSIDPTPQILHRSFHHHLHPSILTRSVHIHRFSPDLFTSSPYSSIINRGKLVISTCSVPSCSVISGLTKHVTAVLSCSVLFHPVLFCPDCVPNAPLRGIRS